MTTAQKETVLITAQTESDRLEQDRDDIAKAIKALKRAISAIQDRLEDGETDTTSEDKKVMSDVRFWLRVIRETEAEIDAIRRRDAGIVGEYGLDFEEAERAIGCRLNRIRACCGADGVSG